MTEPDDGMSELERRLTKIKENKPVDHNEVGGDEPTYGNALIAIEDQLTKIMKELAQKPSSALNNDRLAPIESEMRLFREKLDIIESSARKPNTDIGQGRLASIETQLSTIKDYLLLQGKLAENSISPTFIQNTTIQGSPAKPDNIVVPAPQVSQKPVICNPTKFELYLHYRPGLNMFGAFITFGASLLVKDKEESPKDIYGTVPADRDLIINYQILGDPEKTKFKIKGPGIETLGYKPDYSGYITIDSYLQYKLAFNTKEGGNYIVRLENPKYQDVKFTVEFSDGFWKL